MAFFVKRIAPFFNKPEIRKSENMPTFLMAMNSYYIKNNAIVGSLDRLRVLFRIKSTAHHSFLDASRRWHCGSCSCQVCCLFCRRLVTRYCCPCWSIKQQSCGKISKQRTKSFPRFPENREPGSLIFSRNRFVSWKALFCAIEVKAVFLLWIEDISKTKLMFSCFPTW